MVEEEEKLAKIRKEVATGIMLMFCCQIYNLTLIGSNVTSILTVIMCSDWYRGEALVDFEKVDAYVHQLKGSSRLVLDCLFLYSFLFHLCYQLL
jgi:hypothetical protein